MENIEDVLKKVTEMQSRIGDIQSKLETVSETGVAGGGLVRLSMNGSSRIKSISVDVSLLSPAKKTILEDLIVQASSDAKSKIEQMASAHMASITRV